MSIHAASVFATPLLTTLVNFNDTNGSNPIYENLLLDASGNVYGTTMGGGANGNGTVFKVAAGTHALTTLASFDGNNGLFPEAGVIADGAGNLYGTTITGGANGGGVLYKVAAGTHALSTVVTFGNGNGSTPMAGLIADSAGNMYGTTRDGGQYGVGTVYKIAAGTNTLTTLASFNQANGGYPDSALYRDASGNLYGTTSYFGSGNAGTAYKIAAGTNSITVLASFNSINAYASIGSLIGDAFGNLYGTTNDGGTSDAGTVFKIAAGTNKLTTLVNFNNTNGAHPFGNVIIDYAGNLFGTNANGGPNGADGTIFEIAANTNALTTLATFGYPVGYDVRAAVTADAFGNFYGTTNSGGTYGGGTVFELTNTGFVVPEPGSLALVAVGSLFLRRTRSAKRAVSLKIKS